MKGQFAGVATGTNVAELETPCLLVDDSILEKNLVRMASEVGRHGVKLRPHSKTHKNVAIGKRQVAHGAVGLTVAKVGEAEVFVAGGIEDVFIAYPVFGRGKVDRLVKLLDRCKISVGIDSFEGAAFLNNELKRHGVRLPVLLELDTGLARTGASFTRALDLAKAIDGMGYLDLVGIYTFRGALAKGLADAGDGVKSDSLRDLVAEVGREEARLMVEMAEKLREAGLSIDVVSVGSTPTAIWAASVPGVTEVRPGTYVYNDSMQAKLESCGWEDCATKAMVTVVSRPAEDLAIIDGGSKVFAGDAKPGTPPANLIGFGTVVGENGEPREDMVLERITEEHGMLRLKSVDAERLEVGQRLLVIPNHVCTSVNLFDEFVLVSDLRVENWVINGSVKEVMSVDARGRVW